MMRRRVSGTFGVLAGAVAALIAVPSTPVRAEEGAQRPAPCPVVNSREISFAWDAPAGDALSAIDVYQTRDGKSWEKVHTQEARRRDVSVVVPDDGWYGFSVTASGEGGAEPAPGEEDAPEIEVLVDTRGPEIAFLAPESGSAWDAARPLPVRWRAEDACGIREVQIDYRQEGSDAWRPVRRAEGASGEWLWMLPDLLKARFEVRLVAVDAAGNHSAPSIRPFRLRTPPAAVPVLLKGPAASRERDVALSVELEDGGWDEIDRVELWQTIDSGKTWSRRAESFREEAPSLSVRLEETGRYGFFVRPVPPGAEPLESLDPGVLPHLECWANFPPPVIAVRRQDPPSPTVREKARRHYLAAQAALARRDATTAREGLEASLAAWPDFTPAANDLACLAIGEGKFAEAQLLLERVVALDPGDADYRFNLGVVLMSQKRPLEALGHLEKGAEETSSRKAEAQLVLAECLMDLGDLERAAAICRGIVAGGDPARLAARAQRMLETLEGMMRR